MARYTVNDRAVAHAKRLIERRQYVLDSDWGEVQPRAEDENRFLVLSPEGEALAKGVIARKKIFERFLLEILKVSHEQAEIDACKTEHLISAETARKLEKFIKEYQHQKAA